MNIKFTVKGEEGKPKVLGVDGQILRSIKETDRKLIESTPFQFIGVLHTLHLSTEDDFAEVIIKGFDLSCCQFAIESPSNPALVICVHDQALELFKRNQFFYDLSKFRNMPVFCKRVSKYLSRGYMLVGFKMGEDWSMMFQNVRMVDEKNDIVYDGDAVFATMMFRHVRDNPVTWDSRRQDDPSIHEDGLSLSRHSTSVEKEPGPDEVTDNVLFGAMETIEAGDSTQLCLRTPLMRNFPRFKPFGASPLHQDTEHQSSYVRDMLGEKPADVVDLQLPRMLNDCADSTCNTKETEGEGSDESDLHIPNFMSMMPLMVEYAWMEEEE